MSKHKASEPTDPGEALGLTLLRSVREMKTGQAARKTRIEPNEVVQARHRVGLSQAEFARALSISRRTLQEWEQGRRSPSGAAKALIGIAKRHPEVIRKRSPERRRPPAQHSARAPVGRPVVGG